ncbi:sec-independent protein translocase protein TatB [Formivibrio citricus]|uniref:Sec-independent protein translocase protein TatB n=1 Tax=Formivibrio citricus TaxID=83765 RepID=A0A1I5C6N1_9NEIS|nr:Sec-independent protein translocase protein TatB [Formivibrio citricus]SFN82484.1 sec-independent protein translocase protein TatB [Formivibrio citricus]
MFDISLGELSVIGAVALVVLGPEKLPKVARAAGLMLGRAQRMAADFRADLERDLHNSELAELGKQMAEEEAQVRQELAAAASGVHETFSELEKTQYGDSDPELDALENRRHGGDEHEDLVHPYHEEVDPELQSLDLQRYGGAAEDFSPLETAIVATAPAPSAEANRHEQETGVAPGAIARAEPGEGAAEAHHVPLQPDLFAAEPPTVSENIWRDRR